MDIASFISEQESKMGESREAEALSRIVPDPVPSDPPGTVSGKPRPPQVEHMLACLGGGYARIEDLFDGIPEGLVWRRRAVKELMGGEKVSGIETALTVECRKVWDEESEAGRDEALRKLREGMKYLVGLVEWKIGQGQGQGRKRMTGR